MQTSAPRIIIIEDNPADVRLLRYALDETGEDYYLQLLRDGEEALEFVRQCTMVAQPHPCIILLDLHLPKYDGISVLRSIREEPSLAHVKVAVLTTVASPEEESTVRALGVSMYTTKPHDLDELKDFATEVLRICNEEPLQAVAGVVS
jgi:DNA-binding response OmpR family regulator